MSLTDEDKLWITYQLERVQSALNAKVEHVEAMLNAKLERVETALLTEFHKWASPIEMRVRSHSAVLRAIDGYGVPRSSRD